MAAVLSAVASSGMEGAGPASAAQLVSTQRVLVIAHRGDSRQAPENTLSAFASAVNVRADLVELDYHHSSDGVPVVFHDKRLDRTSNSEQVFGGRKIPIASKTWADLRLLDAGAWFDGRFAGTGIPLLEESLDLIQAGSVTLIERKNGAAAVCIELLRRRGLLEKVVVQSFDWSYLGDCRRLAPEVVLAALGGNKLTERKLALIENSGARIVGWSANQIDKGAIDAIHRRGFRAWAYTVNDLKRAAELIEAGIDGVITDIPQAMLELVRALTSGPQSRAA